MSIVTLKKDSFAQTVNDNNIVIVDFWAPWCGPCKSFEPIYEEASKETTNIIFARVNIEEEQELAANFKIRSIPMLMIFREQIAIFSQAGVLTKSDLYTIIDKAKQLDMDTVRQEIAKQKDSPKN